MVEPVWIGLESAHLAHSKSLANYGGADSVRDLGLLDSALRRPQNLWHYSDPKPDISQLAAARAHGIAKNHPFMDGNKRTAWILCRLMLQKNGATIEATQEEKIAVMLDVASSNITEQQFAVWLRQRVTESG